MQRLIPTAPSGKGIQREYNGISYRCFKMDSSPRYILRIYSQLIVNKERLDNCVKYLFCVCLGLHRALSIIQGTTTKFIRERVFIDHEFVLIDHQFYFIFSCFFIEGGGGGGSIDPMTSFTR